MSVTAVIFRVDREGTVFALFPELPADYDGLYCLCYQHVGEHCSADYFGCIAASRLATADHASRVVPGRSQSSASAGDRALSTRNLKAWSPRGFLVPEPFRRRNGGPRGCPQRSDREGLLQFVGTHSIRDHPNHGRHRDLQSPQTGHAAHLMGIYGNVRWNVIGLNLSPPPFYQIQRDSLVSHQLSPISIQ